MIRVFGPMLSFAIFLSLTLVAAYLADPASVLIPIADLVGGWVMYHPIEGWSIQF